MGDEVTNHREVEKPLAEAARFARATLDALSTNICVLDDQGTILTINRSWHDFGDSNHLIAERGGVGQNYLEVCDSAAGDFAEEAPMVASAIRTIIKGEQREFSCEYPCHSPDTESWFLMRVQRFPEPGPVRIVVAHENVTAVRQADLKLQESETRLQAILDNSPGLIFLKDLHGRYFHVNHAFKKVFGFREEVVIGKTDAEIFPLDQAQQFQAHDQQVRESQTLLEFEEVAMHADGPHTSIVQKFPLFKANHEMFAIAGITTDITARKKAEHALAESEERFRQFTDQTKEVIWVVDWKTKHVIYVNAAYERVWGRSAQELYQDPLAWILPIHPDDRQRIVESFSNLSEEHPYDEEYRIQLADGSIRWIWDRAFPIFDQTGGLHRFGGYAQDISDRKAMEEQIHQYAHGLEFEVERRTGRIQELEQRRMQVEKLAALSQIAASIAHEINNPLASISQAMTLVKAAISPAHQDFHYTEKIEECIERMARITRQLFDLCRPTDLSVIRSDVLPIVNTAIEIMQSVATRQNIRIQPPFDTEPHEAFVGRSELVQVLCNLIQNSIDASAPNQVVIVQITTSEDRILIQVSDEGSGIAATAWAKIFESFYSTKHDNQTAGMGLGLSVSRSLIEAMGGRLDFQSLEGKGSTFTVSLPSP